MRFEDLHSLQDTVTLMNGVKMPCIGYGTWQTPKGGVTRECVKNAIEAGYRHIDTAYIYGNEDEVGQGVRDAGVKREDLFITTKHWVTERGYKKTLEAVDTSLKLLGMDYVDLYLVHWPCVARVSENWEEINAETWRGFEAAYKAGKLRAVGVSNYQQKHVEALWKTAEVKPMVNQLECHPGYLQTDTVTWMQRQGIAIEAWSPLGSGAVLKNETLVSVAAKYGKSTAQICVRFLLQLGVVPLPKSTNPGRTAANAQVFDFTLSDEDMRLIADLPQLGCSGFFPEDAPADAIA